MSSPPSSPTGSSPPSPFSSDTDSDVAPPPAAYLIKRLNLQSLHPTKQHAALLAAANTIAKNAASCAAKVIVAGEAQAVADEEKVRLLELTLEFDNLSFAYDEIKASYDDYPLGRKGMPEALTTAHDMALRDRDAAGSVKATQEGNTRREEKIAIHAAHEAAKAEAMVARNSDIMEDLARVNESERREKRLRAKKATKSENEAARTLESRQRKKAAEFEVKVSEATALQQTQTSVARTNHKEVADRVKETTRVAEGEEKQN